MFEDAFASEDDRRSPATRERGAGRSDPAAAEKQEQTFESHEVRLEASNSSDK